MDLGCLPRSWGGGPTSAQASLCPSYPTAATLGLVVRMEHRQGGRRQAVTGGWRPWGGPISSRPQWEGEEVWLEVPAGVHPLLGAGPGICQGVAPPPLAQSHSQAGPSDPGSTASCLAASEKRVPKVRPPTKCGHLAFMITDCVSGAQGPSGEGFLEEDNTTEGNPGSAG